MLLINLKETVIENIFFQNYNVLIDGRNFYDQSTNDQIKKYDEVRKVITGKGDNYSTGSSLDYYYHIKQYQLTAVDLSKQKNWMLIQELFNKLSFMES